MLARASGVMFRDKIVRDNSEGLIKILDAFESDGKYFSTIEVPIDSEYSRYRFGVSREGYVALKRIVTSRPLADMPGMKYRYFWDGSMGDKNENTIHLGIRCEVEGEGRSFDFEVPHEVASNLQWFWELRSLDDAKHLQIKT